MKARLPIPIHGVLVTARLTRDEIPRAREYAVEPVSGLAETEPDHTRSPAKARRKSSDDPVDAIRLDRRDLTASVRHVPGPLQSVARIPARRRSDADINGCATPCSSPGRPLVRIRDGGAKTALFCIHAAAGHLRLYENLARHLGPDRPVYGLRSVAQAPYRRLQDLAERYVREIRKLQPIGPYIIVGECGGGALAYEVAQQLRVCAESPLLVLVDSFGPGWPRLRPFVPQSVYRVVDATCLLCFHLRVLAALDWRAKRAYLAARISRLLNRVTRRIGRRRAGGSPTVSGPRAFRDAVGEYVALPFDGRGLTIYGASLPWGVEPQSGLGWGNLIADLAVCELPAYFGTNLLEPNVGVLADEIERLLDAR